jgi:glycosyltransferase involved in cell wall biosynthesis
LHIAFHTPLNVHDDGRISGDRRMAGQIATCLEGLGHTVEPVRNARSYMATPEPALLDRLQVETQARIERLVACWRETGTTPDLWFTYHSYYKAPDLLGPAVKARLGIPYVVAEASGSERRAKGPWSRHVALARASFGAADLHLCFTERDRSGVEFWCGPATYFLAFPPFIALDDTLPARREAPGPTRLATVAMMRPGVKHDSYLALARTLTRLANRDWTLSVVGGGPLRPDVEAAFASLPAGRVAWRGALPHDAVMAALAESDVFVWPGLGEAYGLVYLEAQAMGLPVVAYASGGVPATVKERETALLAEEGDEAALAGALARLIDDPDLRRRMGRAAAEFVTTERTQSAAGRLLEQGLALACAARAIP